jgi:hypothetical protein
MCRRTSAQAIIDAAKAAVIQGGERVVIEVQDGKVVITRVLRRDVVSGEVLVDSPLFLATRFGQPVLVDGEAP